jgi:hypothetical protein
MKKEKFWYFSFFFFLFSFLFTLFPDIWSGRIAYNDKDNSLSLYHENMYLPTEPIFLVY